MAGIKKYFMGRHLFCLLQLAQLNLFFSMGVGKGVQEGLYSPCFLKFDIISN